MILIIDALRDKEVINVKDGGRLGFVGDVEVDVGEARLTAVVVLGRPRLFGLLGREPDLVVPWGKISLIGDDTVLVEAERPAQAQKPGFFHNLLEKLGV